MKIFIAVDKTNHIPPQKIVKQLCKRFPGIEVKPNSEFSKDCTLGYWIPNAEEIPYTNKDKNTLYKAYGMDLLPKHYEFEVYKKFDAWLNKRGYYATTESYAMQIFPL